MAPFPRNEDGERSDLLEDIAMKHYSIQSVFGTPPPRPSAPIRRPRSERVNFETVVKKKRSFTRPGENPEPRKEAEEITADNLFKPRQASTLSFKPRF